MIEICDMTLLDYENLKENLVSEFDDFWTPEILKSELIQKNRHYLIAKYENEIVGFAGFLISFPEIELMNIVIKKSERNKGIGTLLLEKIIEISTNQQFEKILLEVNEKNKAAIHLYEKFGFTKIGMRKQYYNALENAIILSKKCNNL